jgi:hypothetical protein
MDPASFLASLIGVQRNMDLPVEVRREAQELWVSILDRKDRIESLDPSMRESIPASDVQAPMMRSVRDIVEGSPTKEQREKHAKSTLVNGLKVPAKTAVYAQLVRVFPAKDLAWVNEAQWSGPTLVPMSAIDTSDREQWVATRQPEIVAQKTAKLRKRREAGKTQLKEPIVLVEGPNGHKVIADGHHRYLSVEQEGQDHILAYTAHVRSDEGPWNGMGAGQLGGPSGPK